ncbi:MYB transcription factor [Quillaja saponaria]|uniref:MYB transcription factor n=1 Tax=Quillaja saponaria TaxID=32244 RepID=A0AAD7L9U6_QUISA|nr:MYB transcription factor [Quillaja saponaria]
MHDMKKKKQLTNEDSKKKERHIVTWTQEEDGILRGQISIHGTEKISKTERLIVITIRSWAIIASKFHGKTTRQCRRRWYTYLNSDFKKGGWSPEEDMLLCEAQKIFGNRWTEIAKVVSGRTDNAVKNRFSTLCKKRAKYEALAKENTTSFINPNKKRIIIQNGGPSISDSAKNIKFGDRSHNQCGATIHQQTRAPFAVIAQNFQSVNNLTVQHHPTNSKFISDVENNKIQGTFLKKDDPKISALLQQAELLSSLALKVNTENTEHSLETAWKVLQDFLNQNKETDILRYKIPDLQLEVLKDMIEDLRSSDEGSRSSWRQPDLYEDSPDSSEYSTGSTLLPRSTKDDLEHPLHHSIGTEFKSTHIGEQKGIDECKKVILSGITTDQDSFPLCEEQINNDGVVCTSSSTEFSSPLQVTPLFRSLAAGIPTPQFSESERNFLMKTLGMESPCTNPSQPPPCKRILLNSL